MTNCTRDKRVASAQCPSHPPLHCTKSSSRTPAAPERWYRKGANACAVVADPAPAETRSHAVRAATVERGLRRSRPVRSGRSSSETPRRNFLPSSRASRRRYHHHTQLFSSARCRDKRKNRHEGRPALARAVRQIPISAQFGQLDRRSGIYQFRT